MKLIQYQEQLRQTKMNILALEKLKKQQQALEMQLNLTKQDVQKYEQELENGRIKLNKLEGFSFINLYRNLTGQQQELKEERLERLVKAELKLIEAQLMYEDLNDDLIDTIYKINSINEDYLLLQIKDLEHKIQVYYMEHHPEIAAEVDELEHQQLVVQQLLVEIHEAISAGKEAKRKLADAAKALRSAKNYSTWDMFGGGLIATALKHQEIDKSKASVHRAQIALQRFQNELLDIQEMKHNTLQIDTDGFVKFADYFFDDIFSAWSIHSKISTSTNQIARVLDDVSNTLLSLQQKLDMAERKKEQLIARKAELLSEG